MLQSRIQVPSELFALAESSHFEGTIDIPTLEAGPDDYAFAEPLAWSVDITNTGSAFLVEGSVTGTGTCPCARCLEDVIHDFKGDIEGYFLLEASESDADEDVELEEDEFDVLPADHVIDLEPLIEAALIMDAPEQPLCKDDCLGLCTRCGANLNDGPCGCEEQIDPTHPFATLANFTFES